MGLGGPPGQLADLVAEGIDRPAVPRHIGQAPPVVGEQDGPLGAHHQGEGQQLGGLAVVAQPLGLGAAEDPLGLKAPVQQAGGLHPHKAVQHPRRVADDGEGQGLALQHPGHLPGAAADHAGQPHPFQVGQGLEVAGDVGPGDGVVEGGQEDHDQGRVPGAQAVKIVARRPGGVVGETRDRGPGQMIGPHGAHFLSCRRPRARERVTKTAGPHVRLSCLKKNPARSSADKSNLPLRTGGCPADGFMLPHRTSRVDPDGAVCNPPPDSRLPMDD